ncbi:nuclease-related domain-containing protein [Metaplanococcus flavidus]|uniref:Nuclease-related domain-containing protein n=1 Tax=Metaplanococcus flavidus TaxID=569883 RepID=A0ABW3LDI7_9BACL
MEREKMELLSMETALSSLIGRMPAVHSQLNYLKGKLHRTVAGSRGEERMRQRFIEFQPEEEVHALWDVGLAIGSWKTQFDGIVLTRRGAIVIDSKNISGKLHFDDKTGEFYRFDDNDVKEVFDDPRIQLNKNIRFLSKWFTRKKINLPVSGLIVFTPKNCEFIVRPKGKHLCKVYQMPEYLFQILKAFPLEAKPSNLPKIKKQIVGGHVPYLRTPLCAKYYIEASEIRRGVQCMACRNYGMKRIKKSWQCPGCAHRDRQAHKFALREYFSLIDTHITNQAFREWCGVSSRSVATRLLSQFDFVIDGESKARRYSLKKRD